MKWLKRLFKKKIKKAYGIEAWHYEVPYLTRKEKLEVEEYLIKKHDM